MPEPRYAACMVSPALLEDLPMLPSMLRHLASQARTNGFEPGPVGVFAVIEPSGPWPTADAVAVVVEAR